MKLPLKPKSQRGSVLIEAMVSVLIFSIGILALVALQVTAMNAMMQGKIRADAAFLVNQLIGKIRIDDISEAGFSSKYLPSGQVYTLWRQEVEQRLPNADKCNITVSLDEDSKIAAVSVGWKSPQAEDDDECHNFTVVTQIADN